MMTLQPIVIAGSAAGLQNDTKPFFFKDQSFQKLNNAFVFRERVVKRQGLKLLGRLQRNLTGKALGNTVGGVLTYTVANIFTTIGIVGENAELVPGGLVITIGAPDTATFTDNGNGTFTVTGVGIAAGSYVNYATGQVIIKISASIGGSAITATVKYYPGLPVMGIIQEEENVATGVEQTLFFDTKYAYISSGAPGGFSEFITGTTWDGNDNNFFSGANYTTSAGQKALFVTNNSVTAGSPIRFTDGATWTALTPQLDSVPNFLFQAQIIIPYYGRLLAFNTWEGTALGTAVNFFNRCRFSVIGDPTAATAWRIDIFGKGGFVDAPTNEAIISATFFKNTLIVEFEYSTWQLRYVGQYGLPFIWERISSDYGSASPYAAILFDQGVRTVGDRAITECNSNGIQRIDHQIPDLVFSVNYANNGLNRVHGIRDFQRELVFWSYNDSEVSGEFNAKFPNRVLVNNYRNATFSIFRDNVTCFGIFQAPTPGIITWGSTDVTWDDAVTWDDPIAQNQFPSVVSGNQEGYVHFYGKQPQDQASLSVTGIILSATDPSVTLTVKNHNLESGDIIYLTGLNFVDPTTKAVLTTDLNNNLYSVFEITNADVFSIAFWDGQEPISIFTFTPVTTAEYIGGGQLALMPRMEIQTKDFNPFQPMSRQMMISYVDFLFDTSAQLPIQNPLQLSVAIYGNTSVDFQGNITVGNNRVEFNPIAPFNPAGSNYMWHRFYATMAAQYISLLLTYDDALMNDLSTHQQTFELNAMTIWCRPAGKLNF